MDEEQALPDPAAPVDEGPSLRDTLAAALVESNEAQPVDGEAPPATPPDAPSTAGDRTRGPDGKFLKAAVPAAAQGEAPASATASPAPITDQASAQPGVASGEPPATWSPEAKANWQNAHPTLKAEVLKRELDFANGLRQAAEKSKPAVEFTNHVLSRLAPHQQDYRAQGMNEAQAIDWLVGMHEAYKANPKGYALHVAKAAGLVLPDGQPATAPNGAAPAVSDPFVQRLATELNEVRGFVSNEVRARQEAANRSIDDALQQFTSKLDASGKPAYPHLETVEPDMVPIMKAIRAQHPSKPHSEVLSEAYDRAVWANPTTRAQLQAAQQAEAETKRLTTSKTDAARARTAATPTAGAPGGASASPTEGDLREQLKAAFRSQAAA